MFYFRIQVTRQYLLAAVQTSGKLWPSANQERKTTSSFVCLMIFLAKTNHPVFPKDYNLMDEFTQPQN